MNRRRQLQQLKKLSALEVGNYIPASECVGKEFAYGQYLYRVVEHHSDKQTFTLEMVNAANMRIEKPEAFVRHHCTLPTPREITPCRYECPVFPEFPKRVIPAVIVQNEDIEHQPTDDQMIGALETPAVLENPPTPEPAAERQAVPGLDPAYYLDQIFSFESGGATFTVTVQAYNERRKQFRLYDIRPEARSGSFYRDAAFVYQHCQPAAQPVVREPLPQPTFDPYRFWNLVSLSDKRQIIAERVQQTGVPAADPLLQCACCGQSVMILGIQIYPPKYNRKNQVVVECQNEDCVANDWTATTETHHEACEKARAEALRKGQSA